VSATRLVSPTGQTPEPGARTAGAASQLSGMTTIMRYAMQEALRRKVFLVVLLLTLLFLGLFWVVNHFVFRDVATLKVPDNVNVNSRTFAGAFLLGLGMFATLFLGVVLAVFLTLGVVSGDAERGLLQPLVVRPIGRAALLGARFLGAAAVCAVYVLAVYFASMLIIGGTGHWWPHSIVTPGLELAAAVVIVAALSLLGSILLSATANGIAIFMLFGAGLVAGLLGSIGHALNSHSVKHAATIASWVLPFEALYQDALRQITSGTSGLTGFLLQLGPFGGAYVHGWPIRIWALAYLALIGAAATAAFARRDL
jgi:Cu-processing system permease protein